MVAGVVARTVTGLWTAPRFATVAGAGGRGTAAEFAALGALVPGRGTGAAELAACAALNSRSGAGAAELPASPLAAALELRRRLGRRRLLSGLGTSAEAMRLADGRGALRGALGAAAELASAALGATLGAALLAAAAMFLAAALVTFRPAAAAVVILGRGGSADQAERQGGRDHVFHSSHSDRAPISPFVLSLRGLR
jgi:hypothetical protein